MAKGKLILICQSGGEFVTNDDGTMSYNGGEATAANVTSETPFNDLKLNMAETCDINQETISIKYFLPGNKRNLITLKNDKDVKRMIEFHGEAITAEVFVMGMPGFDRSALDMQNNRRSDTKNDEPVKNDNMSTKKEETVKEDKVRTKKDNKVKKYNNKLPKSLSNASPAKRTRRALAAAKVEPSSDEKTEGSTGDTSTSASSERVNENADSDFSSDYAPSKYTNQKKRKIETNIDTSPADTVKKRRRTPSWKLGANGRPTIVAGSARSKPRRKSGKAAGKSRRKSGRLAGKSDDSVEPLALAVLLDDDVSPETLVSGWKSAITGAGQEFTSVDEFREALQKYAIANHFMYQFKKNDTTQVTGECAGEGCSWMFSGVWIPNTQSFKIKTMNNVHTCNAESENWLVNTIKEKLGDSPHLKTKEAANILLREFGEDLNCTQHHGSHKDSYNKLPLFCKKIIETNPGSITKLVIGENKRFKSLFVTFYASLCGFQNSCRPLLFLESTSLRSKYGEVLLMAFAVDGNDGFVPVTFAIVDVEDDNSWRWFLEQLKFAISNSSQPITFVFDREKNLKKPVLEIYENAHVGYSIYHLLESFKRAVKGPFHGDGKVFLPVHFLAAAHAVRFVGFRKSTEQIKQISSQAYDWVMQVEPENFATSSFKGERYNHITDNVSESFSKLMEDNCDLPILNKIDTIIRFMIDFVNDAKLDASMWGTKLTPLKEKELQEESFKSHGLKVLISSDTLFEVREDSTHVVNISNWSCTCLKWKETGLPCRHALAVFALIGKNVYEFCSNYFTVDVYRLTYNESIVPVPIEEVEKIEMKEVGGENDEGGKEKMEVEKGGGENEETGKTKGENEEAGKTRGEKGGDEKEEGGNEKMEMEEGGGENEEGGKTEGEKGEDEKDEGGKCKIGEEEEEDLNVIVLPPIPVKAVVEVKEKIEWEETEGETKRTVTCTKCKQPGHNKKSCNLYQVRQSLMG